MGDYKFIRLEVADVVARLVLARPPLNILNIEMMEELNSALERVQALPEVRALVIAAEGKAFSAGVAVEDHLGGRVKPMLEAFHRIFHLLPALPSARLPAAVEEVLAKLRDKSRAVLALTRRAVLDAAGQPFEAALRAVETLYHAELMATEDAHEGLRAFVEKRAPTWRHR